MSAITPQAASHSQLPPMASRFVVLIEQTYVLEGSLVCGEGQAPNKFFEADGRVTDFLGNDWEKAWGRAINK